MMMTMTMNECTVTCIGVAECKASVVRV